MKKVQGIHLIGLHLPRVRAREKHEMTKNIYLPFHKVPNEVKLQHKKSKCFHTKRQMLSYFII